MEAVKIKKIYTNKLAFSMNDVFFVEVVKKALNNSGNFLNAKKLQSREKNKEL